MRAFQAPFPYFGGKSSVAERVWQLLGQPKHYLEPFFGSGAVLLNRPGYVAGEYVETVCDKDGHLANVWRALQADPDAVAKVCDWPVNHIDLNARRLVLLAHEARLVERLTNDPGYYDATLAGYWVWAASCWIGSGLTRPNAIPHLDNGGKGVHAVGQRLDASSGSADVRDPYNTNLYVWFRKLAERLRYVRVVCGEWTRVCGGDWQDKMGDVGMFFDPPYAVEDRDTSIYHHDATDVAHAVREWCLARGENPTYRIVLAGYDEHRELLDAGWTAIPWKARGGYGNQGDGQGAVNRHREMLYASPHCLGLVQGRLWDDLEEEEDLRA